MDSLQSKMNYYNTGFMGGFLYNLPVDAMEKPENYSEAAVKKLRKPMKRSKMKRILKNLTSFMS